MSLTAAFDSGPWSRRRIDRVISSRWCVLLLPFLLFTATSDAAAPPADSARSVVYVVPIDDAIGPVTAKFAVAGIARAERAEAAAVILLLDTPGGLDASMRHVIKAILAADVPVVVYVAPAGARAASAGMYITLAATVAAMAPGTNLGAATPVSIGAPSAADTSGTMHAKLTNDAAAYARSLAERSGRNADWAERAVREAASLPAEEAVAQRVVDLVAADLPALLTALDGRVVRLPHGVDTLRTAGAIEHRLRMSWRETILARISDPSLAYLLFLAGLLGLALELYNPGAILPGVVGAISLILAFLAFASLPVNAAGVLLILLGLVLFILEVKVPSYGVLSIGGVASLLLGSLFLFERGSALRVSVRVVVPAVVTFALVFLLVVLLGARAQRRPKQGGAEGMVGEIATAITGLDPTGRVFVHGEYWNACSRRPAVAGARVRVVRVDGLLVEVEPVDPIA